MCQLKTISQGCNHPTTTDFGGSLWCRVCGSTQKDPWSEWISPQTDLVDPIETAIAASPKEVDLSISWKGKDSWAVSMGNRTVKRYHAAAILNVVSRALKGNR